MSKVLYRGAKKAAEVPADANVEQSHKDGSTMGSPTTDYSISDLFRFCQEKNEEYCTKPVNSMFLKKGRIAESVHSRRKKEAAPEGFDSKIESPRLDATSCDTSIPTPDENNNSDGTDVT